MRLHTFRFSPNALKVRLAFAELGLEYETHEVDLFRGEHLAEVFAQLNPFQRVPVLEHDDLVLRESNAIVAYLGEQFGSDGLWPRASKQRARALQWLFFEANHLAQPGKTLWWNDVVAPRMQRPGADAVVVADAASHLRPALELLDHHFIDHEFVLGPMPTLVDCVMAVALDLLRGTRADQPDDLPRLSAYRERVRQRPSWAASHGDALHTIG